MIGDWSYDMARSESFRAALFLRRGRSIMFGVLESDF